MPEASVAIDFEEGKALEVFGKLNEVLLAMKKKGKVLPEEIVVPTKAVTGQKVKILPKQEIQPLLVSNLENPEDLSKSSAPKYKGFAYIKCPICGKERGFCMKKESDHYHCDGCGSRSVFDKSLVPLFINCECGKRFKYLTNMTDSMFDINCIGCGSPVAVKWNKDKRIYETIK